MPKGYRKERLEREILRQVSEILAFQMKDPRLGLVTVTRVQLSNDLSLAKVFVSKLEGSAKRDDAVAILNRARGFIRTTLRKGLSIRQTPEVRFEVDKGLQNVHRVNEIFKSLKGEKGEEE